MRTTIFLAPSLLFALPLYAGNEGEHDDVGER